MTTSPHYMLQFGQLLTVFFIMLGPLRATGAFANSTTLLASGEKKELAVKSGLFALLALVLAGFIGDFVMKSWGLKPATLLLTVGILFLIAAIRPIIRPAEPPVVKVDADPVAVAMKLLISPHGLAAVVVLFALSHDRNRILTIIGALAVIIVIDIVVLGYNKAQSENKSLITQLLRTLLGTLQFALSIQIIHLSLKNLGVL
ncbi:MAG: hypothetical protein ACJ76H_17075 [Bacteriovoracaceae bacterium]